MTTTKSIEEKAKAYDEALKYAKIYYTSGDEDMKMMMKTCFPALVEESEDERIRKVILWCIRTVEHELGCKDIEGLAVAKLKSWLEKQGEHANFRNKIQIGDKVTRNKDGVLVNISQLNRVAKKDEKQGENNMGISEATKKKLEDNLTQALGKETPESWNDFLDEQDYQPVNTDYISGIRVGLLSIEGNAKNINGLTESQWVAIRAANRLLAEYIEKVQQKPWSEEDERKRQNIEKLIRFASPAAHTTKEEALDWLKSLKDRVLQKPAEWSEENEKMFEHIIAKATLHFSSINYLDEEEINFLKSLRPQPHWKPSDKQMKAIEHICDGNYNVDLDILDSIYRDFKKLRK